MRLTDTKANDKHSLVEVLDGVYLKTMSMSDMQNYFDDFDKKMDESPVETVDKLFNDLIVDSEGNKFEELLEGGKASEKLPLETIKAIVIAIPGALLPNPKQ